MPVVMGCVVLLGLLAMCFMAVWVADDVWNAVSRVIWLVLTAIGLILLATMSRLPQMLTLRRSLLLITVVTVQLLMMVGVNALKGVIPGFLMMSTGYLLLPIHL